jgi:hypothetical protein
VDVVDIRAEALLERLDRRGRDRRAAAVDLLERGEVAPLAVWVVEQADERGDRGDRERRAVALGRLEATPGSKRWNRTSGIGTSIATPT